jgi:hypothetical protein
LVCTDEYSQSTGKDNIIYFESSNLQPTLSGFYIERVLSNQGQENPSTVYTQIKTDPRQPADSNYYLFKLNDNMWMIGDRYGEDAGMAVVEDSAVAPHLIQNRQWRFTGSEQENHTWVFDDSVEIYHPYRVDKAGSPLEFVNIYVTLRFARSIKYLPSMQKYVTMRNDVPIPQIGLGTGGIPVENLAEVLYGAIQTGYRFFDLAREYGNEHIVGDIVQALNELAEDEKKGKADSSDTPSRRDLFIQSKVWPTHLGVLPTLDSIYESLGELKVQYLDAYLLHWPL